MANQEVKRAKFVRLAESRTTKALNAIRVIGNLSNRINYSYTASDIEQIFGALQKELDDCRQRFAAVPEEESQTFFKLSAE
ncbi:MAG: hypothetical protein IKT16_10075 [Desulfovibrio sp.]|nr:hypothetical protein [Desulfovibrio sp.]MBR6468485.1 hypothetical protein [Desulfovibrio sp.]